MNGPVDTAEEDREGPSFVVSARNETEEDRVQARFESMHPEFRRSKAGRC